MVANYSSRNLTPIGVRAIQGHSKKDKGRGEKSLADALASSHFEVPTVLDESIIKLPHGFVPLLFHGSKRGQEDVTLNSIISSGSTVEA